jgi:hypothetical protein
MWNKIKRKSEFYFLWLSIIFGICCLLYLPIKCGKEIIHRAKNPSSEIYAENLKLDKWVTFCIDEESEGICELEGYRLKTKSKIGPLLKPPINVLSVIEVDQDYEELTITLRDWKSGEIIEPYPQKDHNWYQFYKKYDSFKTIGTLIDENGDDIISYEVTLMRDKIVVNKESCDSRGYEENNNKVKGGCFFLEDYEKTSTEWHTLEIELRDGRIVLIQL